MLDKLRGTFDALVDTVNKSTSEQPLVDETAKLMEEAKHADLLLKKLDAEKESLEDTSYQSLKNRYENRIAELDNIISEKKSEMSIELKKLNEQVDDYNVKITVIKGEMDDLKLRYKLGEFGTDDYTSRRRTLLMSANENMDKKDYIEKKVTRFEKLLS